MLPHAPALSSSSDHANSSDAVLHNATHRTSITSNPSSYARRALSSILSTAFLPLRFGLFVSRALYKPTGLVAILYIAWHLFQYQSLAGRGADMDSRPAGPELDRIDAVERSISSLILEKEVYRHRQENEVRMGHSDLLQKYDALGSRVQRAESRADELEQLVRLSTTANIDRLFKQVAVLQMQAVGRSLE